MTVKDSGELVGGALRRDNDDELTIKVLRGFMREGKPVEIGSELTLKARLARELIAMNKAEVVAAPPEAEAEPEDEVAEDEDQPKRRWRKAKE
jgi:hypothetical protein